MKIIPKKLLAPLAACFFAVKSVCAANTPEDDALKEAQSAFIESRVTMRALDSRKDSIILKFSIQNKEIIAEFWHPKLQISVSKPEQSKGVVDDLNGKAKVDWEGSAEFGAVACRIASNTTDDIKNLRFQSWHKPNDRYGPLGFFDLKKESGEWHIERDVTATSYYAHENNTEVPLSQESIKVPEPKISVNDIEVAFSKMIRAKSEDSLTLVEGSISPFTGKFDRLEFIEYHAAKLNFSLQPAEIFETLNGDGIALVSISCDAKRVTKEIKREDGKEAVTEQTEWTKANKEAYTGFLVKGTWTFTKSTGSLASDRGWLEKLVLVPK